MPDAPSSPRSLLQRYGCVRATPYLALFLGVCLLAGYHAWWQYQALFRQAGESVVAQGQTEAEQARRLINEVDLVLRLIAGDLARHDLDDRAVHEMLARHDREVPQSRRIMVVDADGNLRYDSRRFPAPSVNLAYRTWFQDLASHPPDALYIGGPIASTFDNTWLLPLARRRETPDGRFAGTVGSGLRTDYLTHSHPHGRSHNLSWLVTTDGVVVTGVGNTTEPTGWQLTDFAAFRAAACEAAAGTLVTLETPFVGRALATCQPVGRRLLAVTARPVADVQWQWLQRVAPAGLLAALLAVVLAVFLRRDLLHWRDDQARARELGESERRFRMLMQHAGSGILLTDADRRLLEVNRQACEMLGRSLADLRSLTIGSLLAQPEDRSPWNRPPHGGPVTVERTFLRADGGAFPAECTLTVLPDGTLLTVLQDISARKAVEAERLRLISAMEQTAEGIAITEPDGHIVFANAALVRLTGRERDALLQLRLDELASDTDVEEPFDAVWTRVRQGAVWQGHVVANRRDGGVYNAEITLSPVKDGDGRVINHIAVVRDLTAQMNTDARLLQMQKLEAIGSLASGIAHDLNNMLTPIMGFSEIMKAHTQPGDSLHEDADIILQAAQRARQLVGQVLLFSRRRESEALPADLRAMANEVLTLLRNTLPKGIVLEREWAVKSAPVPLTASQQHTVLMNLCVNASQAMDGQGTLRLSLAHEHLEAHHTPQGTPMSGSFFRLTVTDTGCGMDAATQARIFEPFFTTKGGQGTGLGLSTVADIVHGAGGFVEVDSIPGAGTTLRVHLPEAQREGDRQADETPADGHRPARVLLVDDEPMIVDFCRQGLEQAGHEVHYHHCGANAVACLAEKGDAFDIVVTDLTMPGLHGQALLEGLRAAHPTIPIVVCSGYPDAVSQSAAESVGIHGTVPKPFTLNELVRCIHSALSDADTPPDVAPSG